MISLASAMPTAAAVTSSSTAAATVGWRRRPCRRCEVGGVGDVVVDRVALDVLVGPGDLAVLVVVVDFVTHAAGDGAVPWDDVAKAGDGDDELGEVALDGTGGLGVGGDSEQVERAEFGLAGSNAVGDHLDLRVAEDAGNETLHRVVAVDEGPGAAGGLEDGGDKVSVAESHPRKGAKDGGRADEVDALEDSGELGVGEWETDEGGGDGGGRVAGEVQPAAVDVRTEVVVGLDGQVGVRAVDEARRRIADEWGSLVDVDPVGVGEGPDGGVQGGPHGRSRAEHLNGLLVWVDSDCRVGVVPDPGNVLRSLVSFQVHLGYGAAWVVDGEEEVPGVPLVEEVVVVDDHSGRRGMGLQLLVGGIISGGLVHGPCPRLRPQHLQPADRSVQRPAQAERRWGRAGHRRRRVGRPRVLVLRLGRHQLRGCRTWGLRAQECRCGWTVRRKTRVVEGMG
ncbi:hypothetical protein C8F01DRAFT_1113042 [Mycena amicta]|nr:hypothetical protein C8F01DRAFT_1113042 [Mycena amicta]